MRALTILLSVSIIGSTVFAEEPDYHFEPGQTVKIDQDGGLHTFNEVISPLAGNDWVDSIPDGMVLRVLEVQEPRELNQTIWLHVTPVATNGEVDTHKTFWVIGGYKRYHETYVVKMPESGRSADVDSGVPAIAR